MKNKLKFEGDVVTMEVLRKKTGEVFNVKFSKEHLLIVEKHYWVMTPNAHCIHCNYRENGKLLGPSLHKVLYGFKFVTYLNGDNLDYTKGNVLFAEKSGPKRKIGQKLKGNEFSESPDGCFTFTIRNKSGEIHAQFVVDKEDFDFATGYTWDVLKNGYVHTRSRGGRFNSKNIYLHRALVEAGKGEVVDHVNRDKMDNRRANLRKCTASQNQHNRDKYKNNTSGHNGISILPSGSWKVDLQVAGKQYRKAFKTFQEAIDQYNAWKKQLNPSGLN